MTNATNGDGMDVNQVDTNTEINQTFPGGDQQTIPDDPSSQKESSKEKMGSCTSAKTVIEKPKAEAGSNLKQTTLDKFVDKTPKSNDDRESTKTRPTSPKRLSSLDDDTNKRTKSSKSDDEMDTDDNDENKPKQRQSGPATRSSGVLSRLSVDFKNSDDEDDNYSGYYSWAKRDTSEYRSNYPTVRSDSRITDNYDFYTNKISSHPDGDFIDNIHKKWFGQYRKLEYHHGYIQWLFPLQEKGLNWSAEPLQKHEIESIKKDKLALRRILLSYKLMLDFYGFELVDEKTGKIRRSKGDGYRERFHNLNTSSHNYLRITRILKCLGEFDYEYLKFSFLEAILREAIIENTLVNCLRSCQDYWIETLRSQEERRAIRQYARELIKYRKEGISPPKSHHAIRPTSSSPSTKDE